MLFFKFAVFLLLHSNCYSFSIDPSNKLTTISFPEDRELELTLGVNENALLNFTESASKNGYTATEHTVVTDDGYILILFRLQGKEQRRKKHTPVLMMHGLLDLADTWIISGPDVGLGYILADQGYDVWCGNVRGNRYSRKHVRLNPDEDVEFWDFTFHHHGVYDLPALVDYVLEKTGAEQLSYIGHSQGSTIFFVLGSTRPEYNKKFNIAACLGPAVWLYNLYNPVIRFIASEFDELLPIVETLGLHELFASHESVATAARFLCQYLPQTICGNLYYSILGYNTSMVPQETLKAIAGRVPAGSSRDNFKAFVNLVNHDRFSRFDYGAEKNLVIYGSTEASDYDLSAVSAPVAIFCGKFDWFVSLKDVKKLRNALPNVFQYTVLSPNDWGHLDFIYSTRLATFLAPKVIDLLQQFDD